MATPPRREVTSIGGLNRIFHGRLLLAVSLVNQPGSCDLNCAIQEIRSACVVVFYHTMMEILQFNYALIDIQVQP